VSALAVRDHVKVRDWDEGVGVVRRVGPDGGVWVETLFNMWRNYPSEMFVKTDEPLPRGLEANK
jgi:hypothetical protein